MENVHGVDVSWIHHAHHKLGDSIHKPNGHAALSSNPPVNKSPSPPIQERTSARKNSLPAAQSSPAPPQDKLLPGTPSPTEVENTTQNDIPQSKRQSLLRRASREKVNPQNLPLDPSKSSPKRSGASSWISSLSSKLGSPSPQHAHQAAAPAPTSHNGSIAVTRSNSQEEAEAPVAQNPTRPGSSGSFFSNALRRLSSSSQLGPGQKMAPHGGMCPRRVLNVDPNRQRCYLPELETIKLRRVAFCVDVEIAGGPRYNDEAPEPVDKKKMEKDRKVKERAEGAALKNPAVSVEEKEQADPEGERPDAPTPAEQASEGSDKKEVSRKKEKKKRSEEERKERKEYKRRKAEESGAIPMMIVRSHESLHGTVSPPHPVTPPISTDRPTTDPLRIYRRCCQLRETPILKRITEQLARAANTPDAASGIIPLLDLTGSRLTLHDFVTLSDWLAIVPVQKLLLENADLSDEAVRVILAGLLAAQTPTFSRNHPPPKAMYEERSGVVEKLTLKNNPKLSKDGWKHISLFLYLCKSIKSLDVSMNAFPPSPLSIDEQNRTDPAEIFGKAISERLGGAHLEELIMGECSLTSAQIRHIIDAVTISAIKRLGLAGNSIDQDGLKHIIHYIRSGACQGIDLGGNDLQEHLDLLGEAFELGCPIWALSLASCNLDAQSLRHLFPGLLNLDNLRFVDFSFNPELFTAKDNALGLLRKYLPMMKELKRIHLNSVDMAPSQAIALADTLAEVPTLAHISILDNPQITALADAREEESQEEACALYASLMAAARVSRSLISVEVDIPTPENSEIVKALAKQVVAYCLRNMEDCYALPGALLQAPTTGREHADVHVPDVLLHIVGELDGQRDDEPAPDNDYIVGGQGVVKALNYCLADGRHGSMQGGAITPLPAGISAKAKNMSKELLDSARKIRRRIQPALFKEAGGSDDMAYRRLLFLDNTLKGIIQRFEDEYPETRIQPPEEDFMPAARVETNETSSTHSGTESLTLPTTSATESTGAIDYASDSEDDESELPHKHLHPRLGPRSRHASDVSLAAKAQAKEEGAVHKIGQEVKRHFLERDGSQVFEKATHDEVLINEIDQVHSKLLREKLKAFEIGGGDEKASEQ